MCALVPGLLLGSGCGRRAVNHRAGVEYGSDEHRFHRKLAASLHLEFRPFYAGRRGHFYSMKCQTLLALFLAAVCTCYADGNLRGRISELLTGPSLERGLQIPYDDGPRESRANYLATRAAVSALPRSSGSEMLEMLSDGTLNNDLQRTQAIRLFTLLLDLGNGTSDIPEAARLYVLSVLQKLKASKVDVASASNYELAEAAIDFLARHGDGRDVPLIMEFAPSRVKDQFSVDLSRSVRQSVETIKMRGGIAPDMHKSLPPPEQAQTAVTSPLQKVAVASPRSIAQAVQTSTQPSENYFWIAAIVLLLLAGLYLVLRIRQR